LHDLAVEDAVGPAQRPKLDRYATHLFLARAPSNDQESLYRPFESTCSSIGAGSSVRRRRFPWRRCWRLGSVPITSAQRRFLCGLFGVIIGRCSMH
jgi:hypothetical protein